MATSLQTSLTSDVERGKNWGDGGGVDSVVTVCSICTKRAQRVWLVECGLVSPTSTLLNSAVVCQQLVCKYCAALMFEYDSSERGRLFLKMLGTIVATVLLLPNGQQPSGLTLKTYTNMGLYGTPASTSVVDTAEFSHSGASPFSAELVGSV